MKIAANIAFFNEIPDNSVLLGRGGVLVSVNTSIRLKIGSRKSCRQEELFKSSDNIRNFVRECK